MLISDLLHSVMQWCILATTNNTPTRHLDPGAKMAAVAQPGLFYMNSAIFDTGTKTKITGERKIATFKPASAEHVRKRSSVDEFLTRKWTGRRRTVLATARDV